jgi:putative methyltransferase (TIGR04325 family)
MNLKYSIIQKIPADVFVFLRGKGWRGNFKSWAEASRLTTGYTANNILEKFKMTTSEARSNHRNRDPRMRHEMLSTFMWIAAQNKGNLNVIDFGGALGETYYYYKTFFDQLETVKWNVVEQPHFVEMGKKEFECDVLKFHFSVDDTIAQLQCMEKVQCILFSGVLQYLEKPYEFSSNCDAEKPTYHC